MRTVMLPHTDLTVSAVCMGVVFFGTRDDERTSFHTMDCFTDHGGSFVDTAITYADWLNGEKSASEKMLGKWLKARHAQNSMVVATKGGTFAPGTRTAMLRFDQLEDQAERSRQNLGLDQIALYYLHRDDPNRPVEEIMDTLFELRSRGWLKHLGCSNWREDRIGAANAYAEKCGQAGFVAISNRWSLARCIEGSGGDPSIVDMNLPLYDFHTRHQIAAIPFTSTAQGYLSKLAAGKALRPDLTECYGLPENDSLVERAMHLAEEKNLTVAQIALAYFSAQPFCSVPISSFSSDVQIAEAAAATECVLSSEEYRFLTGEKLF